MQLYTVHGLTNYRNIVGAYALLPNKKRATYVEMLTEVQRLTHNAMPHSLMTDFESIMLSALNQIYPAIQKAGCLFHLAKNVFRRSQDIGLHQNYQVVTLLGLTIDNKLDFGIHINNIHKVASAKIKGLRRIGNRLKFIKSENFI